MAALAAAVSCSSDDGSAPEKKQVTFKEVEQQLEMKGSFSELSKRNILRHYGTADNFLDLALKRKAELSAKNSTKSNKTAKMMAAYTITVYDPWYGSGSFSFWCWDDEYILDKYYDWNRKSLDCDGVGMSPACVAKLWGGRVDQSEQSFLNDEEMQAGWVLPCRAYPQQDCTLNFRQEENFVPI